MNPFAADRFFDVPRTTRQTSEGPVELPIFYYDVSTVIVLFAARLAGLRVLELDDVRTTGATLAAACEVLLAARVAEARTLTLAIAERHG